MMNREKIPSATAEQVQEPIFLFENLSTLFGRVYIACLRPSPCELEQLLRRWIDCGMAAQFIKTARCEPLAHFRHVLYFLNAFLYFRFAEMSGGKLIQLESTADQINLRILRLSSLDDALHSLPTLFHPYCIVYNAKLAQRHAYSPLVRSVLNRIHSSLNTGEDLRSMSVSSLAAAFHVTPKYLSNRFARETGRVLTQEINQVRIFTAKYLLQYSDFSLEEISERTGFSSQSYLTRRFKQAMNVSPTQYRRQVKAGHASNDHNPSETPV